MLQAEPPISGCVGCAPAILPQSVTAGGRKIRATDSTWIATFVRRLSTFGPDEEKTRKFISEGGDTIRQLEEITTSTFAESICRLVGKNEPSSD